MTNLLQAQTSTDGVDEFTIAFSAFVLIMCYRGVRMYRQALADKQQRLYGQHPLQQNVNALVYAGKDLRFSSSELDHILLKHFPYYRHLHKNLKQHFIRRLYIFLQQKTFIIRSAEGYKEMPVLLSAAAIQITFGLPYYHLPFFRYMQIHPEEYFADNSLRVLAGHVYGNTITVAWNHFYKNYQLADGVNVGLHEMAHALYFQHLQADAFKKKEFVAQFEQVMEECEGIFSGCRATASRLFKENAFKDLQEFWAESLEWFFEKPLHLKTLYPHLYDDLCALLQQDPSNAECPVQLSKISSRYWKDRLEYALSV